MTPSQILAALNSSDNLAATIRGLVPNGTIFSMVNTTADTKIRKWNASFGISTKTLKGEGKKYDPIAKQLLNLVDRNSKRKDEAAGNGRGGWRTVNTKTLTKFRFKGTSYTRVNPQSNWVIA